MPKLKYVKQSDGNSDTKFEQQKKWFPSTVDKCEQILNNKCAVSIRLFYLFANLAAPMYC